MLPFSLWLISPNQLKAFRDWILTEEEILFPRLSSNSRHLVLEFAAHPANLALASLRNHGNRFSGNISQ